MVIRVAEIPKGSRSGKLAIQSACLSSLSNLRRTFLNPADYEPSMQDDRNLAAVLEAKVGCKFHILYLLIKCEDPDENHLLNEIVRAPISQTIVDRPKRAYLTESWENRLTEHFQISDDTLSSPEVMSRGFNETARQLLSFFPSVSLTSS
ncbi:hypothetical protein FRC05_008800 [Tulasnella sp. 425]|nr:hypothetical protein FRC05_008800 [Tulasnella sp. 425]